MKPNPWASPPSVKCLPTIFPRWRIRIPGSWPSPGPCPMALGWIGSNPSIPTGISTSASPRNTRCSLPPAWPPRVSSLFARFTPPSCSGPMTRLSTTSVCRICRWCSAWIGAASPGTTVRPITDCSTSPTCGACRTSCTCPPRMKMSSSTCSIRPASTTARAPSGIPGAPARTPPSRRLR